MVDLAVQLINRQTAKYDPSDFEDRYETRVRAMIDAKIAGMPLVADEEKPSMRGNVIDLVVALKKSIAESKAAEPKAAKTAPKGPPPNKGSPQPANRATRKRA
jgi:DNA end-binding protein Ku